MPRKKVNLNWADEEFSQARDPTATGISPRHWEFRARLADVVREAVRYAGGSTSGNDGGLRQAIRNLDALQLGYDDEYSALLVANAYQQADDPFWRERRRSGMPPSERTEILPATPRRKLKLT